MTPTLKATLVHVVKSTRPLTDVSDSGILIGRRRSSGRVFYAAVLRQQELPWQVRENKRLGLAEMPSEVRLTPEDIKIARAEKPIPPPTSNEDAPRYRAQLNHSPLYQNVLGKLKALEMHSPGGQAHEWSVSQFTSPEEALRAAQAGSDYRRVYHSLDWSRERQGFHQRGMKTLLNPEAQAGPGKDKHFVMIIGPPGAGKSTSGVPFAKEKITPHYTTVNVDEMHDVFPEYQGWNPLAVRKETAYLTYGPFMAQAFRRKHHILYDATGNDSATMESVLKTASDRGYHNHLILVHRPAHTTMAGAWNRFLDNPYGAKYPHKKPSRYVNPGWAYDTAGFPEQTYQYLKMTPLLHSYARIHPNVIHGEKPILVEHSKR